MSKNKTGPRKRAALATPRRSQIVIAVAVVLSLFAAWTILAYSGALEAVFREKGKKSKTVSTASLNSNSPSKEFIYGAGGRLLATEESGSGCGSGPSQPGALVATASSAISVDLVWGASTGVVDHYEVERRNGGGSYAVVKTVPPITPTVTATDTNGLIGDTAYLYRVRAFDSSNCPSPYSSVDLATTVVYSENVVPGVTIKAVHLTELRTAVNAVRATAGLAEFNWADSPTPTETPASGSRILKDQIQKLRERLNSARSYLELPTQSYTNEPLNIGDTVYAAHIQQLRDGVK